MNDICTTPTTRSTVTNLYARLAGGDLIGAVELLHPDVVLHVPGSHPLAGDHRGVDAVIEFVAACRALTDGTESTRVLEVAGGPTLVAALCLVTAARVGRAPLENETVHLHTVAAGRITRVSFHNADQVSVDAFWGAS